jgi:NADPH:quinone reductase-like Zn-dependent oxidoreductase
VFRQGRHFEAANFPARIGYEAAGVVAAVGAAVDGVRVGDRVSLIPLPSLTRWGTYGDWVNVPADHVVPHPEELTFEQDAAMWMAHLAAFGAMVDAGHFGWC